MDLGEEVPVLEIADDYLPNDTRNLLVNEQHFGDALATTLLTLAHNASRTSKPELDPNLALQRGHWLSIPGTSVPEVVHRVLYTTWNADLQSSALTINYAVGIS